MLVEHQELISFIKNYMAYTIYSNYNIDYIEEEFTGIQVQITYDVNKDYVENLQKLIKEKYSEIVSFIYTMEKNKLFVIYLKPIGEIRSIKINTIKSKINGF